MIERLFLLLLLGMLSLGLFYLLRLVHVRRIASDRPPAALPTLLYFRSDTCSACGAQQRYIEQLTRGREGGLVIETIDADREQARSKRYGVLTLPMTIWLDHTGQASQINYGLTDTAKLERQWTGLISIKPSSRQH